MSSKGGRSPTWRQAKERKVVTCDGPGLRDSLFDKEVDCQKFRDQRRLQAPQRIYKHAEVKVQGRFGNGGGRGK